ncbi:MAG: TlpA family protein disulfide reductase [Synergistaceae bacterium]|nr:TlpA family protein disulfide reductase [Synergistaceae bacterium]
MSEAKKIAKRFFQIAAIFLLILGMGRRADAQEFPKFSSKNFDGKVVTSDIFRDHKITMVNFWTTWCPPCIGEMPDLGKLGRAMPDGTQLIGIALDAENDETIQEAKSILRKANADFPQIVPCADMASILETVEAIPTTIFVDSKGNIVGEPIVGARNEQSYRKEIEAALKALR